MLSASMSTSFRGWRNPRMGKTIDYAIYGKIIIDDIRVRDGSKVHGLLGGGGPQAAFGARLWSESVGLLTRTGNDFDENHAATLRRLRVDLAGWRQVPDVPTPRVLLQYDADEYLDDSGLVTSQEDWLRLLSVPLDLPAAYARARAVHLVTEFPEEPMVSTALDMQARGALFSLEPLPERSAGTDWDRMLALIANVDIVCPDWPSAMVVAETADPARVVEHWSGLGPACVAIRHGALGSYVWGRDRDEAWHIPAVLTEAVDPTGAGNAYGGGLCVGWTETRDARVAGCYGAISASMLVRQVGLPPMSEDLQDEARSLVEQTIAAASQL